jgi:uncharacterized protein (TIGR03435 family)
MLQLSSGRLAGATGIAGIAASILLSLSGALVEAQTAANTLSTESPKVPEWQNVAGGKLSFEVASIKQGKPGEFTPPNFALNNSDSFGGANPHGHFIAEFSLETYLEFAYKLWLSPEQRDAMLAHLPKWVSMDSYAINAQAEGNPTKDQMRLMMQSLLANRFKLAVHFETKKGPVLALVLDKSGKTGPKLYPHARGLPCDVLKPPQPPGSPANSSDVFPAVCDEFQAIPQPDHSILIGSRNVTMAQIAAFLGDVGHLAHTVVDQTGLRGRFDFTLKYTRESNTSVPAQEVPQGTTFQGTTFQQALQEQLGLKLKSTKVSMDTLVIDHVERPSEN